MGQSRGPNHVPLSTESVLCFPASALVTQQQPSHLLPSPPLGPTPPPFTRPYSSA